MCLMGVVYMCTVLFPFFLTGQSNIAVVYIAGFYIYIYNIAGVYYI